MRLRPKQSIEMPKQSSEICKLINLLIKQSSLTRYTCFIDAQRGRENYPCIINDLPWISTNRFYAEKPMGGFYRLTDTCVNSSAIGAC